MKCKILDTWHHGEEKQREHLGHVQDAGEEDHLLHEVDPPEHPLHVGVVHLADQEAGSRVERYAHLPHILLWGKVANRG